MDKKACDHLEWEMSKPERSLHSVVPVRGHDVENMALEQEYIEGEEEFKELLDSLVLTKADSELLMSRFVDHLTLDEIAKTQGYRNKMAVSRAIKSKLKMLREKLK